MIFAFRRQPVLQQIPNDGHRNIVRFGWPGTIGVFLPSNFLTDTIKLKLPIDCQLAGDYKKQRGGPLPNWLLNPMSVFKNIFNE